MAIVAQSGIQTKTDYRVYLSLGYLMLFISIATSTYLFVTFGFTLPEKVIYALIGFSLSILGIIGLSSAVNFYANGQVLAFLFGVALWFCQFLVAVSSHLGFLAVSIQEKASESVLARSMIVDKKGDDLAEYGSINMAELREEKAKLEARREELKIQLNRCNKNYISACINPLNERIIGIDNKLSKIDRLESGYHQYQTNLKDADKKMVQYAEITSGKSDLTAHPLFQTQSVLADIQPSKMQAYFLMFVAVIFELSTVFCFYCSKSKAVSRFVLEGEFATVKGLSESVKGYERLEGVLNELLSQISEKNAVPTESRPTLKGSDESVKGVNEEAVCKNCGSTFVKRVGWQVYCCDTCKREYKSGRGELDGE